MRASAEDAAHLLAQAIEDPAAAMSHADRLVAVSDDPETLSYAHQARGIVLRDRGQSDLALRELRVALGLATRASDRDREADVRATLGVALAMAGRTRAGLAQLDRGAAAARGEATRAKILVRRGHVRYFLLVQPRAALTDLGPALAGLRAAAETVWEARTLNLMGLCHLALGEADRADAAVRAAEAIYLSNGHLAEAVVTLHNRGFIAYCRGDLPLALSLFAAASEGYLDHDEDQTALVNDWSEALLAAGLADDAVELVESRLRQGALQAVQQADLLLSHAAAGLASGQAAKSLASARQARTLFRRQRRDLWAARAELVMLLARQSTGEGGRRLVVRATTASKVLEEGLPEEAATAWLLAGRLALAAGLPEAQGLLDHAAAYRTRSSGLVRASAWQARALRHEADGRRRGVLSACRAGLEALDAHRGTLGSSELRALATRHGDDLSALALKHAVHSGPRALLEWSERWRSTALAQPPVRPPDDDELARDLAALRDTRRRLVEARAEGAPTAAKLDDDRTRLERAIRRRAHQLAGTTGQAPGFQLERLLDTLRDTTFVELVEVDRVLHALVVARGRVRLFVLGLAQEAEQVVSYARFALRQTARGRPSDLDEVGSRLQRAVLGDVARALGGGAVVVSPTPRLHAAPWGLLPALSELPVSIAPSAVLWLRAQEAEAKDGVRVLIAGPGLESGGAELDVLVARHPDAVLLRDGSATVERSLAALDGAAVAHVAAHGRFREDSPMFSSLDLDDGPLTVHDFERLKHAPHRIVLSACESGVVAPIGAGEMLGLVSAMLSMGSAGIVSSVAQVNDLATAALMVEVHRAMDDGDELGHVLLRARRAAGRERVQRATAAAFSAMGV